MRKSQIERNSEMQEAATFKASQLKKDEDKKFDFETFEFKTLADFEEYNSHVRAHNRLCLHERNKMKIKVPNESFHKKVKVKFQRFDQPQNVLKCIVRNKEIEWKGQLKPGRTYMLPIPVVKYLNKLAVPVFAEVKTVDGGETITETKQVGEDPRFSCQVIDFEGM